MENQKHIALVSNEDGDWACLYIDGIKVKEGHSIRPSDVLEALGLNYTQATYDSAEYGNGTETLTEMDFIYQTDY
mgnify:CR=1 FL=1